MQESTRRTNAVAWIGVTCGLLAYLLFSGPLFVLLGFVFSFWGLYRSDRYKGSGIKPAIAGLLLSTVALLIWLMNIGLIR